ncbi:MAG: DMT family transporter, partial [Hyphomicrobiaceae bacterium]
SGLAAILTASTPLVGLFVVHLLVHDEKLSVQKLAGAAIGILGVTVLVGGAAFLGQGAALLSQFAILGSTLLYSLAAVYAYRLVGDPPMRLAACQATSALLFSIPCALLIDQPWTLPVPSWPAIASIVLMGTLSSGLAAIMHFTVLRRAGPSNTFLVTLLLPLTPLILGAIFLNEWLSARELLGAMIIMLALVVIDGRALRYLGVGGR